MWSDAFLKGTLVVPRRLVEYQQKPRFILLLLLLLYINEQNYIRTIHLAACLVAKLTNWSFHPLNVKIWQAC